MLENNNKKSKIHIRSSDLYSRHINQRVFRIQKQIYHYSLENRSKVDIIPMCDGATSTYANLQAVHKHCHDTKHGNKISNTEEPYDEKSSRTVLN